MPPRILIVDDHPINVMIMEELLAEDYQLEIANTGEEALALAPDFCPDLILLDVMMPGIDGYETCRRLRAMPALHRTRVVMVSAKAMEADCQQGYEAGADDYVTKPFDNQALLTTVQGHLRHLAVDTEAED